VYKGFFVTLCGSVVATLGVSPLSPSGFFGGGAVLGLFPLWLSGRLGVCGGHVAFFVLCCYWFFWACFPPRFWFWGFAVVSLHSFLVSGNLV